VRAIIVHESGGKAGAKNPGSSAYGLMQTIDSTRRATIGIDSTDITVRQELESGIKALAANKKIYGDDVAKIISAYYVGPKNQPKTNPDNDEWGITQYLGSRNFVYNVSFLMDLYAKQFPDQGKSPVDLAKYKAYTITEDNTRATDGTSDTAVTRFKAAEVELARKRLAVIQAERKLKFAEFASAVVRPVSDERGYEVIGHYRYGRGASVSNGQLQENGTTSSLAQFPLAVNYSDSQNVPADITRVAQALNSMAPNGADDPNSRNIRPADSESNPTNKPGYFGVRDDTAAGANVDADRLTAARLLSEFTPNLENGLQLDDCECSLSRPSWLGLLPAIDPKLKLTYTAKKLSNLDSFNVGGVGEAEEALSLGFSVSEVTSGQYFATLNAQLSKTFKEKYEQQTAYENVITRTAGSAKSSSAAAQGTASNATNGATSGTAAASVAAGNAESGASGPVTTTNTTSANTILSTQDPGIIRGSSGIPTEFDRLVDRAASGDENAISAMKRKIEEDKKTVKEAKEAYDRARAALGLPAIEDPLFSQYSVDYGIPKKE
jgi:hypothetical protein